MSQINQSAINCQYPVCTDHQTAQIVAMLSPHQKQQFKKKLDDRFQQLCEEIQLELLESDDQSYILVAGQVHDIGEASVADLLVDLQLSDVDRHIEEIRDIDGALMRIATNGFGVCIDCSDEIEIERLEACPTAKRCQPCQVSYENLHVSKRGPTL